MSAANKKTLFLTGALLAACANAVAAPRFGIDQLRYVGALRLPAAEFGASSVNYAEGPIVYHPARSSLFVVGHSHHQALAEFVLPPPGVAVAAADLPLAAPPRQPFTTVLGRADGGNPERLDRIAGLAVTAAGALIVNAYEYYDAPADNLGSTLRLARPDDLGGSRVEGYFRLQGGPGHAAGWLSALPDGWRAAFGASHLGGHSSGPPIIARFSVGPSAFAIDPDTLGRRGGDAPVATTALLDFPLHRPLHADLDNAGGDNMLWTHLSRAVYGFVVPGTRSYLTLGHSGGHRSGVCYKCEQLDGRVCGGYCAPDPDDYDYYYWLWDLDDLLAVRRGASAPSAPRPYAFGPLALPFKPPPSYGPPRLGGASFDAVSGRLYLNLADADPSQGVYARPPLILLYQFGNTDDGTPLFSAGFEPVASQ